MKKLKNNILPYDEEHMRLETTTIPYLTSKISIKNLQLKYDLTETSIKNHIRKDLIIVFNSLNDLKISKLGKFPIGQDDKKYWLDMIGQYFQLPKNRITDFEKSKLLRRLNTLGERFYTIKEELDKIEKYFQPQFENEIEFKVIKGKIFIIDSLNKNPIGSIEDFINKIEKVD